MKFFYKHGNEDWKLLPAAFQEWSDISSVISRPMSASIPLNTSFFDIKRVGLGPVAENNENFEGFADGENINNGLLWNVAAGGTTTCKAELDDLPVLAGKWMKMLDNDATAQIVATYNCTDSPSTPSSTVRYWTAFEFYPDIGYAYYHVREGGNNRIQLRFNGGVVYYHNGSTWTDSGLTYNEDEIHYVKVRTRTVSTFDLIIEDSKKSLQIITGLSNNSAFAGPIDEIQFYSGAVGETGTFYVNNIYLSWITETVGWDEENLDIPFLKIVGVEDSLVDNNGTELNDDFDAVEKIWLGKMIDILHRDRKAFIQAEQWHGQFMRELIEEADNIVATYQVKDFITYKDRIQLEQVGGGAITLSDGEHNLRTCRIEAKETENVEKFISTAVSDGSPAGSGGSVANTQNDDDTNIYWLRYNAADVAGADFTVDITIPVERDFEGGVQFRIKLAYRAEGGGFHSTQANPTIKIFNDDDTLGPTLKTILDGPRFYESYQTAVEVIINIGEETVRDYYNFKDRQFKFRLYSGCFRSTGSGTDYDSEIYIFYAVMDVKDGNQHVAAEFTVNRTLNDDNLLLDINEDVYDTYTNHINVGDIVKILYHDKEFLEDIISNQALDLDAIQAPDTFSLATYQEFKDKQIFLSLGEILRHEAWEYFITRKTYNGKPRMIVFDKTAPPRHGLNIYPEQMGEQGGVQFYRISYMDEVRQVKVRNKESVGVYPATAPLSNFPKTVITRKDLPDFLLTTVAQKIYEQRNGLSSDIAYFWREIKWLDEDVERWNINDDIADVSDEFVAESGDDRNGSTLLHDVKSFLSSQMIHIKDNSNTLNIDFTKILKLDMQLGEIFNVQVYPVTGSGSSNLVDFNFFKDVTPDPPVPIVAEDFEIYDVDDEPDQTWAVNYELGSESANFNFHIKDYSGDQKLRYYSVTTGTQATAVWNHEFSRSYLNQSVAFDLNIQNINYNDANAWGDIAVCEGIDGGNARIVVRLENDVGYGGYRILSHNGSTYVDTGIIPPTATDLIMTITPTSASQHTIRLVNKSTGLDVSGSPSTGLTNSSNFVTEIKSFSVRGRYNTHFYLDNIKLAWVNEPVDTWTIDPLISLQVDLTDGSIYSHNGSGYIDTLKDLTLDSLQLLEVEFSNATQHRIRVAGGAWSSLLTNRDTVESIKRLNFLTPDANTNSIDMYIDNINDFGIIPVKDFDSRYLHEGATVNVFGIASKKSLTDYTMEKYNEVIRQLTWLFDLYIDGKLGYAEATRRSEDEMVRESIMRTRYEVGVE